MDNSDTRTLHRRQALNSLSNIAHHLVSMAIAFLLTPFIVRTLGDTLYGFWVLVISFIGYAGVLEMGIQPAVVKLVGQYRGAGDHETLEELINAALVYFSFAGLVAATLCLTIIPGLVLNHVDDLAMMREMRWIFPLIALDAMSIFFNFLVTGILYGSQRYHVRNLIDACGWILNAVLVVMFLPRFGLAALLSARILTNALIVGGCAFAATRTLNGIRIRPRSLRWASFRQLVRFGGAVFISATTTRLVNHSQPIIISTALSSAATAFYAIPNKLIDYARQFAWKLTASLMPMFSELEGRKERALLRRIYLDYSRYSLLIMIPLIVMLFIYGGPFIGLWIGPDYYDRGSSLILLLSGALLADSLQPLLWRLFIGIGQLNSIIRISAVTSVLVIAASVTLVRPLGLNGVGTAVLTGSMASQLLFALDTCKYLELSLAQLFTSIQLRPLIAGSLLYVIARLIESQLGSEQYATLIGGGLISMVVYVALASRIGLNSKERTILAGWVRRGLRRATQPL